MFKLKIAVAACTALTALPLWAEGTRVPQSVVPKASNSIKHTEQEEVILTTADLPSSRRNTVTPVGYRQPAAPLWPGETASDAEPSQLNRKLRSGVRVINAQTPTYADGYDSGADPGSVYTDADGITPPPPSVSAAPSTCANGACATGSCASGSCSSGAVGCASCGGAGCSACNSGYCNTCQQSPCCCDDGFWWHRSGVWGDYLYLHPTGASLPYAMLQSGAGDPHVPTPGITPDGRVGVVNPGYNSAFRAGASLAINNCSSINVAYTQLHSSDTDTLNATNNVNTAASLVLFPSTIAANGGSSPNGASTITSNYGINFRTGDIVYSRLLAGSNRYYINYDVGARYANLQQGFSQLGNFAQPLGNQLTSTDIKYDGGGLRTGFDGRQRFGNSCFSVYGQGFISVLFGEFRSTYTQLNPLTTAVGATTNWKEQRVTPILDYEVGLSWTSCNQHWRISGGYYTAFWFNAVTTPAYIQAVQTANYTNVGKTLVFDGVVARAEYRF